MEQAEKNPAQAGWPWMAALVVAMLYFAAAVAGFVFNQGQGLAAPFWVGNAIVLVALLRAPRRHWPLLVFAAVAGMTAAEATAGHTGPRVTAVYITADMLEAILAALILRGRRDAFSLSERGDALRFIATCLIAPLVSGAVASATDLFRPGGFTLRTAETWYASNALGLVLFTPALWLAAGARHDVGRDRRRVVLFAALNLAVATIMGAAAVEPNRLLPLLAFPIMGYLAAEFGVSGAASGMLTAALFAVTAAVLRPYFETGGAPIRDLVYNMQVSLAGVSVFVLPLGVIADDKKRIQDTLINCLVGEFGPDAPELSPGPAREDFQVTAALIDQSGVLRLIADEGSDDPAIQALDGGRLADFIDPAQRRTLEGLIQFAFAPNDAVGPRRLSTRVLVDGDWHALALTMLSARVHEEAEAAALLLLETAGARPQPEAAQAA